MPLSDYVDPYEGPVDWGSKCDHPNYRDSDGYPLAGGEVCALCGLGPTSPRSSSDKASA